MAQAPTFDGGIGTGVPSSPETLGGDAGAFAGRWGGRVLGGVVGELFGPEAIIPGEILGGRAGEYLGRAGGTALGAWWAHHMSHANEKADNGKAKAKPVEGCATCPKEAIPCFNTPANGTDAEMDRQLQGQQDGINKMSPDELLNNLAKNRDATGKIVRPPGDARARQDARNIAETDKRNALTDKYLGEGRPPSQAKQDANTDASAWIKGQAALHTPDIVAGGSGAISGVGNRSVNSSIGSQWNTPGDGDGRTRAETLEQEAVNAKERGDKKLDVKLERCKNIS